MSAKTEPVARIQAYRIGHLATVDEVLTPHLVPICFAYDGQAVYSAIDHKPKRRTGYALQRIRNILAHPQVAFLVHHYEEDWQQLAYVMMRGPATILEEGPEYHYALALLEDKYAQYRDRQLALQGGLVIKIVPEKIQHWGWQAAADPA
ncbi:MAG: TIGR03668 family PPOX class F420-dependent oxidoreductase [Candidatus Tectimicrobiota bacterium]